MSQNNTASTVEDTAISDGISRADCRLCSVLVDKGGSENRETWNTVLFETDEFLCTPTVGSLTEGYVLTIPKSHTICAGSLSPGKLTRYWNFTEFVAGEVRKKFGETVIFEHGPVEPNTRIGCGVDHAHLHIVPIGGPVKERASQLNAAPINWVTASSIDKLLTTYQSGNEYLFFNSGDGPMLVGTSPVITSQLFRKAIAELLDIPEKFDWKDNKFEKYAVDTVRRLEGNTGSIEESPQV